MFKMQFSLRLTMHIAKVLLSGKNVYTGMLTIAHQCGNMHRCLTQSIQHSLLGLHPWMTRNPQSFGKNNLELFCRLWDGETFMFKHLQGVIFTNPSYPVKFSQGSLGNGCLNFCSPILFWIYLGEEQGTSSCPDYCRTTFKRSKREAT